MNTHRKGSRALLMCVLSSVLLAACGDETLYSKLNEQEANDMVALLYASGMPASKVAGSNDLYTVTTAQKSFAGAVSLLHANGFPRERFDTLGDVFAKEGFVSSPLEERARLNHALSQEIAHTLSSIDGVVMARVHLAVPEQDRLSDSIRPASASVFVKHRADRDLADSISQIKALVVNGVENLPYENVTVALFQAAENRDRIRPVRIDAPSSDVSVQAMSLWPDLPAYLPAPLASALALLLVFGLGVSSAMLLRRRPTGSSS